jgi:monovalent cation/hydrogen antiporter
MSGPGLQATQITLLVLLLSVVALAALARKLEKPYPIVLVIGGLLFGFVPGMPKVTLDPDIIFFVVLPPLLYAAAWNTSWTDFRENLVTIAFLAIGLVAFTVLSVALAGPSLLPGFDWRIGFVLGAVVATTDSIAATSIAKRLGLPKRIVDILEGESLVNDATGLLALQFGIDMVFHGQTPTVTFGALRLIYLSVAGVIVGLVLARIVEWFEFRIDDAPIEIAISIFVPYCAYLAGELIHASGVLSVVAAGLYLGRKSSLFFSSRVRLQTVAVWNALTFILNGLVFVVIGLQLPYVLGGITGLKPVRLFIYGALFSAFLIFLRLLWTFPGAAVGYLVRKHLLRRAEKWPGARRVFVVGWTGMRGVIALAAAISLPRNLSDGSPFPQRNLIIFLTFSAILVTLVLQGLTLPALIRALGLGSTGSANDATDEARRLVIKAALEHLAQRRDASPEVVDDIAGHYRHRLSSLKAVKDDSDGERLKQYGEYLEVSRDLLNVERETALELRRDGRISNEALREIERDLDLDLLRLNSADGALPE